MNGDVGIWDKLSKVVVFLLLLAVAVAVGFWYLPLIQQNERFRKEIYRLETQIQQEEETSKLLRAQIEAMTDSFKANGYQLKRAFAEAATYCMGD